MNIKVFSLLLHGHYITWSYPWRQLEDSLETLAGKKRRSLIAVHFEEQVITYKALLGLDPTYLQDHLSWYAPLWQLYSSEQSLLKEPSGDG